jgi:hypothetical protein
LLVVTLNTRLNGVELCADLGLYWEFFDNRNGVGKRLMKLAASTFNVVVCVLMVGLKIFFNATRRLLDRYFQVWYENYLMNIM